MTGFRLALGGAQERYSICPDMTCLGKILGGGLPCGAFGGRKEIMRLLAPLGPVYQAGTLSGNPLAMAAGIATVGTLIEQRDTIYPQLERVSTAVADGVAGLARDAGVPVTTNRVGSMFTWFFSGDAVTDYDSAARSNTKQFAAFHRAMLQAGVWLPPRSLRPPSSAPPTANKKSAPPSPPPKKPSPPPSPRNPGVPHSSVLRLSGSNIRPVARFQSFSWPMRIHQPPVDTAIHLTDQETHT